jgi:predicted ATPase
LSGYHAASLGFEGYLAAQRDDTAAAEILLQDCLRGLRESRFEFLYTPFLSGLAEVLATAGRIEYSLAAADEALQRAERNKAFWWMPEALRIKGDVLLMSGEADPAMAAIHFHRSLDLSHRQGALSWELRAATSLARLLRDQGRLGDATACLQPIYDSFTEGFATADLIAAKQLLDDIGAAGHR